MSENGRHNIRITIPAAIAGAVLSGGGVLGWYHLQAQAQSPRVNERALDDVRADVRTLDMRVDRHDTQIAVVQSRLDTIIEQLRAIGEKLDRMERRRQ